MGRALGFITVLIVVAIGGYRYIRETQTITPGGATPKAAIEVSAVRNDLIGIANAERRYWATNAKYASLDDLQANGDIRIPSRANFTFSAETSDTGFTIVAIYSGPDRNAPKRISVDETMTLKTE